MSEPPAAARRAPTRRRPRAAAQPAGLAATAPSPGNAEASIGASLSDGAAALGPLRELGDMSGAEVAELVARCAVWLSFSPTHALVAGALVHFNAPVTIAAIADHLCWGGDNESLKFLYRALQDLTAARLLRRAHAEGKPGGKLQRLGRDPTTYAVDYRYAFAVLQWKLRGLREQYIDWAEPPEQWVCPSCGWLGTGEYAAFEMECGTDGQRRCRQCGHVVQLQVAEEVAEKRAVRAALQDSAAFRAAQQLVAYQHNLFIPRGAVPTLQDPAPVLCSGDFLTRQQYDRQQGARALLAQDSGGAAAAARRLAAGDEDAVEVELLHATADQERRLGAEHRRRRSDQAPVVMRCLQRSRRAAPRRPAAACGAPAAAPAAAACGAGGDAPQGGAKRQRCRSPTPDGASPRLGARAQQQRATLRVPAASYAAALAAAGLSALPAGHASEWICPEQHFVAAAGGGQRAAVKH
eukprot:TRINITY_DN8291_c8_g1_i1.p1 TRINITY_DN8291_c8_g1~~TRINITY_DN8291_c8_g1_i1.p1  ORF type:complete len:489 (+),score=146.69 TRINITY_DN8291_c8_g1_i1:71-1468(+)